MVAVMVVGSLTVLPLSYAQTSRSSIEEHIKTTGHKDIVKTNFGIKKKQNELRY